MHGLPSERFDELEAYRPLGPESLGAAIEQRKALHFSEKLVKHRAETAEIAKQYRDR